MSETRTLNVAQQLKGMAVLVTTTGERLGEVTDAIIHPTEGRMLGITVRTSGGEERALATRDFFIGPDAVMASGAVLAETEDGGGALAGGVPACRELLGTNVVTEDGKLLGRVSEVHISVEPPRVIYRVAESTLQRFFGGGFFIAADVPRTYSPDGVRLIVPTETEDRYAISSLAEAIG